MFSAVETSFSLFANFGNLRVLLISFRFCWSRRVCSSILCNNSSQLGQEGRKVIPFSLVVLLVSILLWGDFFRSSCASLSLFLLELISRWRRKRLNETWFTLWVHLMLFFVCFHAKFNLIRSFFICFYRGNISICCMRSISCEGENQFSVLLGSYYLSGMLPSFFILLLWAIEAQIMKIAENFGEMASYLGKEWEVH